MKIEKIPENLHSSIYVLAQKFSTEEKGQQEACSMILNIVQSSTDEDEGSNFLVFLKNEEGQTLADLSKLVLKYLLKRNSELEERVKNNERQGGGTRERISKAIHDQADKPVH